MEWLKRFLVGKSGEQAREDEATGKRRGGEDDADSSKETLEKGLGQILEHGKFEPVVTTSAEEAVAVLFDRALPATPSLSLDAVELGYSVVKRAWSSEGLVRGSHARVRFIVLSNLRRIQSQPGFQEFMISVVLERCAAQVNAFILPRYMPRHAIPISVWSSGRTYLVCGNADFKVPR